MNYCKYFPLKYFADSISPHILSSFVSRYYKLYAYYIFHLKLHFHLNFNYFSKNFQKKYFLCQLWLKFCFFENQSLFSSFISKKSYGIEKHKILGDFLNDLFEGVGTNCISTINNISNNKKKKNKKRRQKEISNRKFHYFFYNLPF